VNPKPDFSGLESALKGEGKSDKVYQIELAIDEEIFEAISERYLNTKWMHRTNDNSENYYDQLISIYYKLGYDALLEGVWRETWLGHPPLGSPKTKDTAVDLSRGEREWAIEGIGLVDSWKDFESFPWSEIRADYRPYEVFDRYLIDGMKVYASSSHFEHVLEHLLGYEGLFYKINDNPELVKAVFDRWGEIVLTYYENVIDFDCIGAVWHADDLGYKTGTMLSPENLQKYVFPWTKRFATVAHEHGKLFILHSCGNYYKNGVIEDLIDIGVDVIHSFQDVIMPVEKALAEYGNRMGMAGGVDIDSLCRMKDEALRNYLQNILETCTGGRFAYGSGNTIANYVPIEKYCIMLEEGRNWFK
jgi:uroporphyrinogen decarboxylase